MVKPTCHNPLSVINDTPLQVEAQRAARFVSNLGSLASHALQARLLNPNKTSFVKTDKRFNTILNGQDSQAKPAARNQPVSSGRLTGNNHHGISSLDDLFNPFITRMGRMRFDQTGKTTARSTPPAPVFTYTAEANLPLQRQLIDALACAPKNISFQISLQTTAEGQLQFTTHPQAPTVLQFSLEVAHDGSIGYHIKISDPSIVTLDSAAPQTTMGQQHLMANDQLIVRTTTGEKIVTLPDPLQVAQQARAVQSAYAFFGLNLDCNKSAARHAYRTACQQTHPDLKGQASQNNFTSVSQMWKLITWYNGW